MTPRDARWAVIGFAVCAVLTILSAALGVPRCPVTVAPTTQQEMGQWQE